MTRRQIARRAVSPTHKALMLRAHAARGGEKGRAHRDLVLWLARQMAPGVCKRRGLR